MKPLPQGYKKIKIKILRGYKSTPIGNIPLEWEVKPMGLVMSTLSVPLKYKKSEYLDNGTYPIIDQGKEACSGFTNNAESLIKSTPLVLFGDHTKEVKYVTQPFAVGADGVKVLTSSVLDVKFLYFNLIKASLCLPDLGYSRHFTELRNILIAIPPLPEQQKIATILSTWDQAIASTQSIIDTLTLRNKGLAQQLLTGNKRLKGFQGAHFKGTKFGIIPKDWQVHQLSSLGHSFSGLNGKKKDDFGQGKPYIPYMNIFKNTIIDEKHFDYVRVAKNEKQHKVFHGDIFFTTSSETPQEVGMSSVYMGSLPELYLNSFCFGLRLHNFGTVLPTYLSYFFRGSLGRKLINRLAQGATRFNLSKKNLSKELIPLPPLEEQKAISQVLVDAEQEVKLYKKKLDKLQEQKKGLMQKLLTGAIRTNNF